MSLATDYTPGTVPADYRCSRCWRRGCKLWRQSCVSASAVELLCVACALLDQGKPGDTEVNERGQSATGDLYTSSDQIGQLVPAVPTEDGASYWGYTSVPDAGCAWWHALPTRIQ